MIKIQASYDRRYGFASTLLLQIPHAPIAFNLQQTIYIRGFREGNIVEFFADFCSSNEHGKWTATQHCLNLFRHVNMKLKGVTYAVGPTRRNFTKPNMKPNIGN